MTTDKPRIAPPPSVDDVLSALTDRSRIGQVDFTAALATDLVETRAARLTSKSLGQSDLRTALRRVPESMPVPIIEPEPPVLPDDATPEPEPDPEPTPEPTPEPEPDPEPEPEPDLEPAPAREPVAPPADLTRTVEEIARGVLSRMRAAEQAAVRHLEAMELEATRRYELVTAQAELDAELIRLQSRREAHAIITAARRHAGELDDLEDPDDQGHRLAVLSDAISRVADTTESSLTRSRTRETGSSR